MIIEETVDLLQLKLGDALDRLIISDVRIGIFLTAVRLSDGSTGVATTYTGDGASCCKSGRSLGAFTPDHIRGQKVMDLFSVPAAKVTASLKVAVLNALSSGFITETNFRILESADPIDLVDLTGQKTITIVGAFQSYIKRIAASKHTLHVLELDESAFQEEHRQFFVPAKEYQQVLPQSDVVIITGSALVNGTMDQLLDHVSPGTTVIVSGPSSGIHPEVFFRHQVNIIGATRIQDPELFFSLVGEGAEGYHLFSRCARKICIVHGD